MREQYNERGQTVGEQAGVEDSEETSCPICLEPDAEQRTLTSCGHFFCRSTASQYRKANSPDPRLTCLYSDDYYLDAHYLERRTLIADSCIQYTAIPALSTDTHPSLMINIASLTPPTRHICV